jgi:hypothetical protein
MPITSLPGAPDDSAEAELPEASVESLEPPPEEVVTDTDDGGAIITTEDDPTGDISTDDWFKNLADELPADKISLFTSELVELIDADKESRKEFDEMYAEGIKRTGLGGDAPGGATFQGASRVVHPMLSKAAIDYNSRAMGELFPAGGEIVRDQVLGQSDDYDFNPKDDTQKALGEVAKPQLSYAERCDKAVRIKNLMNWQLVHQVPEFRLEMDKLLTQTPLSGSQFLFFSWDERRKRPTCRYWPTDHVWFDYGSPSYNISERLTLAEEITHVEFKRRVRRGEYWLPNGLNELPGSPMPKLETEADKATDKAQGVKPTWNIKAGFHLMARCYCYLDLEDAYEEAPYCVILDLANDRIVSVVRNWEQEDEAKEPLTWANEVPFLPWRGALTLGLIQFIGSLAGASTGAARALLDAAHINNFPAILKLKGANFVGQTQTAQATGITEVEGGVANDADIRKMMMPIPYNPPSPVLYQLLGWASDEGSSFVQMAIKDLAEGKRDMPVGTTLALIEQGLKTMSGIHSRLHNAMAQILKTVYRLNRMYITDEEIRNEAGVLLARRSDFQGPMDVVPISDPEVFSDAQRFAQLQIIADRSAAMPQLYKLRNVEEMILSRSRIPNAKSLLIDPPEPTEQNAVTENLRMAMGQPCAVFPHQDHLAHLQVLLDFTIEPMLGANPLIAPKFLPHAMQHIADHIVMWYANQFDSVMTPAMRDEFGDVNVQEAWDEKDEEVRSELDKLYATASPKITAMMADKFSKLPPIIQKAQALMQQYMPPQPMDPSQATIQAKQMDVQAKKAADDVKLQTTQLHEVAESERNTQDNQTKLEIAGWEVQLAQQQNEQNAVDAENDRVADENNSERDRQANAENADKDRKASGGGGPNMTNGDLSGG